MAPAVALPKLMGVASAQISLWRSCSVLSPSNLTVYVPMAFATRLGAETTTK